VIRRSKDRRETVLESRAVKWARTRGIVVAKLTECAGIPDRIFFLPERPLLVEFKKRGEEPEALQNWYLGALLDRGYTVGWCDEWEGFLHIMKQRGVE
jgi:hypothetical protein